MKKLITPFLILGTVVWIGAGCATGDDEGVYLPQNVNKYDHENREKVVLMDPGAQRSVTTSGLHENRLPDGRLELAANLRNREGRRVQVQVNCEFKDSQGYTLDSTPWQTLILTENGQE